MHRPISTALLTAIISVALLLGASSLVFAQDNVDQILAQFDDEPTVLEVQEAAMAYAGIDSDAISGWVGRANGANALPKQLEYRFQFEDENRDLERFTRDFNPDGTTLGEEQRDELREQDEIRHQVTAEWDLSELVFNPDVLRAAREVGRQAKLREDILTTVTKLYYERRRAQIDMVLNPPEDASDRLRKELRIQELTADIDALTGAWFSGELRRAGKNPY